MIMLKEITMYYVKCDGCKKTFVSPSDERYFSCPYDADEEITENGWVIDSDKCYCPDCTDKFNTL